jgi:hypothetical protein
MNKLLVILLCGGAITMPTMAQAGNSGESLIAGIAIGAIIGSSMHNEPNTTLQYQGESDDATWALYERPELFQRHEQGRYVQNGTQYNGGHVVEYVGGCNPRYRTDYAVGYNNQRIPVTHFVGCW